jgi:hypothetical protein
LRMPSSCTQNSRAATVRHGPEPFDSFSICYSFGRLRSFNTRVIAA